MLEACGGDDGEDFADEDLMRLGPFVLLSRNDPNSVVQVRERAKHLAAVIGVRRLGLVRE